MNGNDIRLYRNFYHKIVAKCGRVTVFQKQFVHGVLLERCECHYLYYRLYLERAALSLNSYLCHIFINSLLIFYTGKNIKTNTHLSNVFWGSFFCLQHCDKWKANYSVNLVNSIKCQQALWRKKIPDVKWNNKMRSVS